MERYTGTARDQNGATVAGVQVYVFNTDGTEATLFDDGSASLGNPLTTDIYGGFVFNTTLPQFVDLQFFYGGRMVFRDRNIAVGGAQNSFDVTLQMIGFRDQAAASAAAASSSQSGAQSAQAAAASSAAGAANSASAASGSATTATAQAAAATTASATSGAYPNSAASNVPRGLTQASVGVITAGSGGTNGTFALAWSSGNFAVNPSGTFTVAGGVVTAVTITGPGLYIGASPTVPTPSFAASSGLSGAAVALTAQFLVTSGQYYWVQSADGSELDRYQNVSGTATAAATIGPLPTVTAVNAAATAAASDYAKSVTAALGGATNKLLIDPRSNTLASGIQVASVVDLSGQGNDFANNASIYVGIHKRPELSGGALQFNSETGLERSGIILSQTSDFEMTLTLEFAAPDYTFATIAARDSAYTAGSAAFTASIAANVMTVSAISSGTLQVGQVIYANFTQGRTITAQLTGSAGSAGTYSVDGDSSSVASTSWTSSLYPVGTTAKVTADVNVSPTSPRDVLDTMDAGYTTLAVNGYYLRTPTGWNAMSAFGNTNTIFAMYDSTGATSRYLYATTTRNGQFEIRAANGGTFCYLRVPGTDVLAVRGPQSFTLLVRDGRWRLFYQGEEVHGATVAISLTNLDSNFINGFGRSGNINGPIGGWKFKLHGLQIAQGAALGATRNVIDAVARAKATPLARRKRVMNLIICTGQSHMRGEGSVTGAFAYADSRGWTGSMFHDGPSSGAQSFVPASYTRAKRPGWYSTIGAVTEGLESPEDIGPVHMFGGGSGSATGFLSHGPAPQSEVIEQGFASEILRWPQAADADYCFVTSAKSGTSLAQLSALSSPPKFVKSLLSQATANLTIREQLYRGIMAAKRRFEGEGYDVRPWVVYNNQIHADQLNASYASDSYTDFVNIDGVLKSIFGRGAEIYAKKSCCVSNTGTALDSSLTPYVDQQLLSLLPVSGGINSNVLPIVLVGPTYIWSQRIHYYSYVGEGCMLGDRVARYLWGDEDSKPLTITWTRIGLTGIRGVPSEPVSFVDTGGMGVISRHKTGGIDTYGLVYTPVSGGATIASVVLTNSTQIDVTISANTAAGDAIAVTGTGALWSNIRTVATRAATLPDQDPSATITTGVMAYQPGANWDLSKWAWPQRQVLT